MSNRRYNSQTRVKKMGGGMMRKTFKAGSSNPKMSAKKKIEKTFAPKKKTAKKKKSFPDLNKDGKVTFADVLQGRGVKKA
jgi:hypothetical protein